MKSVAQLARTISELDGIENVGRIQRAIMEALKAENLILGVNVRTERLVIQPNLTIRLPESCLLVTKVGAMADNGCLIVLGRNEFIRRETGDCDGNIEQVLPQELTFYNVYGSNFHGELYGHTDDQFPAGFYRHNKETNSLELGTGAYVNAGDELYVEFQSTVDEDMVTLIPENYEILIQYKALEFLYRTLNPGLSANYRRLYAHQAYLTKRAERPSPRDLLGALLGAAHNGVK